MLSAYRLLLSFIIGCNTSSSGLLNSYATFAPCGHFFSPLLPSRNTFSLFRAVSSTSIMLSFLLYTKGDRMALSSSQHHPSPYWSESFMLRSAYILPQMVSTPRLLMLLAKVLMSSSLILGSMPPIIYISPISSCVLSCSKVAEGITFPV